MKDVSRELFNICAAQRQERDRERKRERHTGGQTYRQKKREGKGKIYLNNLIAML